jgi:hypothetical protein
VPLSVLWSVVEWKFISIHSLSPSRNDAKTVNVITTACFSKVTKVSTSKTVYKHCCRVVCFCGWKVRTQWCEEEVAWGQGSLFNNACLLCTQTAFLGHLCFRGVKCEYHKIINKFFPVILFSYWAWAQLIEIKGLNLTLCLKGCDVTFLVGDIQILDSGKRKDTIKI